MHTKIGKKEGQLVAVLKMAKSNLLSCKTFLKADLFQNNWQTSTLLL